MNFTRHEPSGLMTIRSHTFVVLLLAGLAACAGPDARSGEPVTADTVGAASGSAPPDGPLITGTGVGCVRIGAPVEDVRRECDVVGDTTLHLEGQPQPALQVALEGDTVIAEAVDDRIWRIRIVSPGLSTADSLHVGTPVRDLADLPDAMVSWGEGQSFLIAPSHCGLSFAIDGLPYRAQPWTAEELASLEDSVRISMILITGGC